MPNIEILNLPDGTPFAIVQNLYSEQEEESILKELDYLHSRKDLWLDPEYSGTAKDQEENPLKSNKCIWMNSIYKQNNASAILSNNLKLYKEGIAETLAKENSWFKYLIHNAEFTTLLSYYENEEHYKPHRDSSILTTLTWFYKKPKAFKGGNIILENETNIECCSNTMLIIPSVTLHEVTPVLLPEESRNNGLGRYTITTFVTHTRITELELT